MRKTSLTQSTTRRTFPALLLALGATACSAAGADSEPGDNGGYGNGFVTGSGGGGAGNTSQSMGGMVPSGGIGGSGPSGGFGNTGGSGPSGGFGNTGGSGPSGGFGNTGGSGPSGGFGNNMSSGGTAGAGNATGGAGGGNQQTTGCDSTPLLPIPGDTQVRGPWPVGQITTKFGVFSRVTIVYPGKPGSQTGRSPVLYDARTPLPPAEAAKIPEGDTKYVSIDSYDKLPIDDAHGPYPAVVFVHGTGSFDVASAGIMAHWASRGFVVISANHPVLYLADQITACAALPATSTTLSVEVDAELAALSAASGDLSPLAGHVDMNRVGLVGHSAGAFNVAQFSGKPHVQVVIPLAGTQAVAASGTLKSSVFVGGIADTVLPFEPGGPGLGLFYYAGSGSQKGAYAATTGHKRILGITGGGHLAVTELCQTNAAGQTAMQVMQARGVACLGLIPALFDCGTIGWQKGVAIVNDITAGVLEETLLCQDRAAQISAVQSRHPEVGYFQEAQ